MLKLLIGVVIATVVVIFTFTVMNNAIGPTATSNVSVVVTDGTYLTLTITGQVNKPGTYVMKNDETIGDLIMAAGGPTTNADARAYLEEVELVQGVSYYIAPINDLNDYCGETALVKVNVNTETQEKLLEVNGVGATIASAIISWRNENGPFSYLEELMEVKGIGKATFEKLKDYIILQ